MNKAKLDEIIRKHSLWLSGLEGGERAILAGADLSGAALSGVVLRDANLRGANLSGADFRGADLSDTFLCEADLSGADLRNADLSDAALFGAILNDADLRGADFSGSSSGPSYYSISWSGQGEQGRRLHAVKQNGRLVFSCGCFTGSAGEILKYIEEGGEHYDESWLRAFDTIMELHEAMK